VVAAESEALLLHWPVVLIRNLELLNSLVLMLIQNLKLLHLKVDSVEASFIEFSSNLPVILVVVLALGLSSVVSRFKARRLRSSGAYMHISTRV
jgi:hypothetical protein